MRDFRDAKIMAQSLRAALADIGLKITVSQSLELIAKAFGVADWNTLSAAIKAKPSPVPIDTPSAPKRLGLPPEMEVILQKALDDRGLKITVSEGLELLAKVSGAADWNTFSAALNAKASPVLPDDLSAPERVGFAPAMEATLQRAAASAKARHQAHTTLDHLLLALLDDEDASAVMRACQVDPEAVRTLLTGYLDDEPGERSDGYTAPTPGFQRVIQRAVIHVQASGRPAVTGANVLVALFSEQESRAAQLLEGQGMRRIDAVNFLAHGITKPPVLQ